jgi:hypothetical protein
VFRPPLSNPAQKRTLRPLYANHQATAYGGFLDPDLDIDFDIYPGTVMQRIYGEVFAPYTGATGTVPFGLSALFVNTGGYNGHEVNEVTGSGTGLFTVWTGGPDAVFEVLAPAFDTEANWPEATGPGNYMLTANAEGQLTPAGVSPLNAIATLIDIPSTDKIVVSLNRYDFAATGGTLAGGS